ncbi:hypothetical protein D915_000139 [Fasciola hepatica]|uniref:Serpentine receptor class gamma n=1 Tax=Fasciola hepatica TaxID=6192 RepID=A0A4E0RKR1_FASHE|nr:hypothetical protein D915_000139 [Fasciola hepatica]
MCFPIKVNETIQPFQTSPVVVSIATTFGYCLPSVILCWLQFSTLRTIKSLKRNTAPLRMDENRTSPDSNMFAISVATVIMTMTYFFSRVFTHVVVLTRSFKIDLGVVEGDWERPHFITYGMIYLTEPLALSLSLPGVRMMIVRLFKPIIVPFRLELNAAEAI